MVDMVQSLSRITSENERKWYNSYVWMSLNTGSFCVLRMKLQQGDRQNAI